MTIQQQKNNQKNPQNKKASSPTEFIRQWIDDFVTKPNPVFGDLPPCPFARKAIVENKVKFLELTVWPTMALCTNTSQKRTLTR